MDSIFCSDEFEKFINFFSLLGKTKNITEVNEKYG